MRWTNTLSIVSKVSGIGTQKSIECSQRLRELSLIAIVDEDAKSLGNALENFGPGVRTVFDIPPRDECASTEFKSLCKGGNREFGPNLKPGDARGHVTV